MFLYPGPLLKIVSLWVLNIIVGLSAEDYTSLWVPMVSDQGVGTASERKREVKRQARVMGRD